MACRRSGVRIPLAPPRGLHVLVRPVFTFGTDVLACWQSMAWCRGLRLLRRGLVPWVFLCLGVLSPGCGGCRGGDGRGARGRGGCGSGWSGGEHGEGLAASFAGFGGQSGGGAAGVFFLPVV